MSTVDINKYVSLFETRYPSIKLDPSSIKRESSKSTRKNSNKSIVYTYGDLECKECGHKWRANLFAYSSSNSNHGCPICNNIEGKKKHKKIMIEKYGSAFPHKEDFAEKCKKTCLEKYGVDSYSKTKEFEERRKATNLEKYGIEYVFHTKESLEKSNQTRIERYGAAHMMQTEEGKARMRQTCLERYGVENPMQCEDICKGHNRKYIYDDLQFDSSWELAYYIYHIDNEIPIEREPSTDIWYEDVDGKKHKYYPDFKVDNKLVEVKGEYWNKRGESNYQEVVGREATVIGNIEIRPYINYCRDKFGNKKWYEQFRRSKKVVK